MAIVITVAQQKGGAGKTMLAANLAAALAADKAVAALDIDPQHSLARWHQLAPPATRRRHRSPSPTSPAGGWRASWTGCGGSTTWCWSTRRR